MPPLEERLTEDGALVQVAIGPSPIQVAAWRAVNHPVPPPELAYALIDTGAKISCIDTRLVQPLGLRKADKVTLWTAGGLVSSSVYEIQVILTMPRRFDIPTIIRAPALSAPLRVPRFPGPPRPRRPAPLPVPL